MSDMLGAMGIPFERVPAVDGIKLANETIRDISRPDPDTPCPIPAQIGCFLSHRAVWERIATGTGEYGLVLEDDVVFARNFASVLQRPQLVDGKPDIVRLEGLRHRVWVSKKLKPVGDGYSTCKLSFDAYGTCGYLISRECARGLLKELIYYTAPIDWVLFKKGSHLFSRLTITALIPAACYQHQFFYGEDAGYLASTIIALKPRPRGARKNPGALILREIARFSRKLRHIAAGEKHYAIRLHPVGPLEPTVNSEHHHSRTRIGRHSPHPET